MMLHCKLVRDLIPDIHPVESPEYYTRCGSNYDLRRELLMLKLIEEAEELQDASTPEEFFDELGDVATVLAALVDDLHLSGHYEKYHERKKAKNRERGTFENGVIAIIKGPAP